MPAVRLRHGEAVAGGFCPQCGAKSEEVVLPPPPKRCIACGYARPPGEERCAECGLDDDAVHARHAAWWNGSRRWTRVGLAVSSVVVVAVVLDRAAHIDVFVGLIVPVLAFVGPLMLWIVSRAGADEPAMSWLARRDNRFSGTLVRLLTPWTAVAVVVAAVACLFRIRYPNLVYSPSYLLPSGEAGDSARWSILFGAIGAAVVLNIRAITVALGMVPPDQRAAFVVSQVVIGITCLMVGLFVVLAACAIGAAVISAVVR